MWLARVLLERLRRTWFGSVLALGGLAIVTVVPLSRHCVGIAAVRGGVGGIFCSWTPPLQISSEPGLLVLLVFTGAIAIIPLAVPNRWVVLATGIATTVVVLGVLVMTTISFSFWLVLYRLGLDMTSGTISALLALLPSAAVWIIASFRQRRTAI